MGRVGLGRVGSCWVGLSWVIRDGLGLDRSGRVKWGWVGSDWTGRVGISFLTSASLSLLQCINSASVSSRGGTHEQVTAPNLATGGGTALQPVGDKVGG